eukprot:3940311-Rhodomonas_salina.9
MLLPPIVLRARYAMCGTEIGYAATRHSHRRVLSYASVRGELCCYGIVLRVSYAMSGIDMVYDTTV